MDKKEKTQYCLSKNPSTDFIWCFVEIEPNITHISGYLIDTTVTDEYYVEHHTIEELIKKGGSTEWIEFLCEEKLSNTLINEIRQVLGMPYSKYSTTLNRKTLKLLSIYQGDHNLQYGALTIKTLEHMGIEIP